MEMFLLLLSGIAWSIVYIGCIRQGFRDKTYAMPLFALGLNIAWETIYTIHDLFFDISVQAFVNLAWMCLDAVMVYTYFKFGKKEFPENAQKYFVPFSILSFATCAVIQLAFFLSFDPLPAAQYSAFAQNAAMSFSFGERRREQCQRDPHCAGTISYRRHPCLGDSGAGSEGAYNGGY